jgi:hypothetical protein
MDRQLSKFMKLLCEVIDTVEQCITPRNNVIHGNKIM